MTLTDLGFNQQITDYCAENDIDTDYVGRVIKEHKGRYIVKTAISENIAEVTGKLIFESDGRYSFPAVGDWVEISLHGENATINSILPRQSAIARRAIGGAADAQIIAANVDYGLIVQAVVRDFNINRLERYITICQNSKIEPIIVLSKSDLIKPEQLELLNYKIKERIKDVPIVAISNETKTGIERIKTEIIPGKTYCLLGSSGVGKSTLINNLIGSQKMETGNIGLKTNKGRHITTHRELVILKDGGIIIDNPGMREVGVSNDGVGLQATFTDIAKLGRQCKFNNCSHTKELGCAVLAAIIDGTISQAAYDNYTKMQREIAYYESTEAERRQKYKAFSKVVKKAKKAKSNRQY
jgi:ribosome biogenesis GTPase